MESAEDNLEFKDITHAIIAIGEDDMKRIQDIPSEKLTMDDLYFDILHFCGYWAEPDAQNYLSLYNELRQDDEMKIKGNFFLLPAPKDLIEKTINEVINN